MPYYCYLSFIYNYNIIINRVIVDCIYTDTTKFNTNKILKVKMEMKIMIFGATFQFTLNYVNPIKLVQCSRGLFLC